MRILNCDFPDDLYYDVENDVWFRPQDKGGKCGISTVLTFLAGKINGVKLRRDIKQIAAGKSLGTIESVLYFGAVRSPVTGIVSKFNEEIQREPRILSESWYERGWVAEYASFEENSLDRLLFGQAAKDSLEQRIRELRVNCFKLVPDDQLYSIGTECSTTLANLDDLLEKRPVGNAVHLVTDDQTADVELIRWTMRTKNELVEARREGNLFHFILKKTVG